MDPSDAFSETLNKHPRKQKRSSKALDHQEVLGHHRLSQSLEPDGVSLPKKPAVPRKPPSLKSRPNVSSSKAPLLAALTLPDDTTDAQDEAFSFNDIRARFEQKQDSPQPFSAYQPRAVKARQGPIPPEKRRWGPPSIPSRPSSAIISQLADRLDQATLSPPHPATSPSTPALPMEAVQQPPLAFSPKPPPPPLSKRPSLHLSQSGDTLSLDAVSRSTTGNSLSSTSSSVSKRSWNAPVSIYNLLASGSSSSREASPRTTLVQDISSPMVTTPATPPTLSSPSMLSSSSSPVEKRYKIMQELLETERAYVNDMVVLKDVYYTPSLLPGAVLSATDTRCLFSNLLAILDFEATFLPQLTHAIEQEPSTVGAVFLENMHTIDLVYCEYCKRHQDAVTRLQELATRQEVQHFLQECAGQLQGKTQSWDLGSLLIKPVQRVLKYPLLLKELMMTTSMDHGDDEDLVQATSAIENVADHINEIKRRKDIVERIVNDKKKGDINVVHGLNKKISRKAQQIRQVAGLMATETTQDSTFDALYQRFEAQQQVVQQLIRDIQAWVRQIKDHFDTLLVLATTLDDVYGAFGGVRVRSMNQIKDFTSLASTFSMLMSRELDASVRGYIYGRIDDFLAVYDNPTQVINKRAQKLLDYDRWRDIKARGDVPDKVLQESADMYLSINAQLAEELPLFLDMTGQYLHLIIGDLARVQSKFYQQLIREWSKLTQLFKHPFVPHTSNNSSPQAVFDPIVMEYHRHFDRYVDLLVSDITILQPVHSESASLDDTSS